MAGLFCWYSEIVEDWKGRLALSSKTGCSNRHLARSGVSMSIEIGSMLEFILILSLAGKCHATVAISIFCSCWDLTQSICEYISFSSFVQSRFEFFKLKSPIEHSLHIEGCHCMHKVFMVSMDSYY